MENTPQMSISPRWESSIATSQPFLTLIHSVAQDWTAPTLAVKNLIKYTQCDALPLLQYPKFLEPHVPLAIPHFNKGYKTQIPDWPAFIQKQKAELMLSMANSTHDAPTNAWGVINRNLRKHKLGAVVVNFVMFGIGLHAIIDNGTNDFNSADLTKWGVPPEEYESIFNVVHSVLCISPLVVLIPQLLKNWKPSAGEQTTAALYRLIGPMNPSELIQIEKLLIQAAYYAANDPDPQSIFQQCLETIPSSAEDPTYLRIDPDIAPFSVTESNIVTGKPRKMPAYNPEKHALRIKRDLQTVNWLQPASVNITFKVKLMLPHPHPTPSVPHDSEEEESSSDEDEDAASTNAGPSTASSSVLGKRIRERDENDEQRRPHPRIDQLDPSAMDVDSGDIPPPSATLSSTTSPPPHGTLIARVIIPPPMGSSSTPHQAKVSSVPPPQDQSSGPMNDSSIRPSTEPRAVPNTSLDAPLPKIHSPEKSNEDSDEDSGGAEARRKEPEPDAGPAPHSEEQPEPESEDAQDDVPEPEPQLKPQRLAAKNKNYQESAKPPKKLGGKQAKTREGKEKSFAPVLHNYFEIETLYEPYKLQNFVDVIEIADEHGQIEEIALEDQVFEFFDAEGKVYRRTPKTTSMTKGRSLLKALRNVISQYVEQDGVMKPRFLAQPDQSLFHIIHEDRFQSLSTQEMSKLCATKNVIVIHTHQGSDTSFGQAFDQVCGHNVMIDVQDIGLAGNLAEEDIKSESILSKMPARVFRDIALDEENTRPLNALNLPFYGGAPNITMNAGFSMISSVINFISGSPFCKPENLVCPIEKLYWGLAAVSHAWTEHHADDSGNATGGRVLNNYWKRSQQNSKMKLNDVGKFWIAVAPVTNTVDGEESMLDPNFHLSTEVGLQELVQDNMKCEGIFLTKRCTMYQTPIQTHAVYTPDPVVMQGWHQLNPYSLHLTFAGIVRDTVYYHDLSNAQHPENQTFILYITRFIHDKLTNLFSMTQSEYEEHFDQTPIPLPFISLGLKSLGAIITFNEISYMISNQRYKFDHPFDPESLPIPKHLELIETRRLSRRIRCYLEHLFQSTSPNTSLSSFFDQFIANTLHSIITLRQNLMTSFGSKGVRPTVHDLKRDIARYLLNKPTIRDIYERLSQQNIGYFGVLEKVAAELKQEQPDVNLVKEAMNDIVGLDYDQNTVVLQELADHEIDKYNRFINDRHGYIVNA